MAPGEVPPAPLGFDASHAHLAVALAGLLLSINAVWPIRRLFAINLFSFFAGWLTAELPLQHVAAQWLIAFACGLLGSWSQPVGQVALALTSISTGLLLWSALGAERTGQLARAALAEAGIEGPITNLRPWARSLWLPFPVRPPGIKIERNTVFEPERRLHVDSYQPATPGQRRPALIFVHGGGWVIGQRHHQGQPLLLRFAEAGWVGFTFQYRLSPQATFPEHIVDVKKAIAWVKQNAERFGVDPDQIAIAGCSAGAHLAALAALTPNRATWQPGFEQVDTRVAQCLAFYGVYDLTNRFGHWINPGLQFLLRWLVFKGSGPRTARYEDASPITHVGADAPPFYLVHGTADSLVPTQESRCFAEALRARSHEDVVLIEVPGGQHAFDLFPSVRSAPVVAGALLFAEAHARHPAEDIRTEAA